MAARKILSLRRHPVAVADPSDNVVLVSVNVRCVRCGVTWESSLSGDEIEQPDCPSCTSEPPAAA